MTLNGMRFIHVRIPAAIGTESKVVVGKIVQTFSSFIGDRNGLG